MEMHGWLMAPVHNVFGNPLELHFVGQIPILLWHIGWISELITLTNNYGFTEIDTTLVISSIPG